MSRTAHRRALATRDRRTYQPIPRPRTRWSATRRWAAASPGATSRRRRTKLGDDQYAAHGFEPKTIFTGKELELALAGVALGREANPAADAAYLAENLFVIEVQTFRITQQ